MAEYPEFLTVKEVAAILKVSEYVVRIQIKAGNIPAVYLGATTIRVPLSALEGFSNAVRGTARVAPGAYEERKAAADDHSLEDFERYMGIERGVEGGPLDAEAMRYRYELKRLRAEAEKVKRQVARDRKNRDLWRSENARRLIERNREKAIKQREFLANAQAEIRKRREERKRKIAAIEARTKAKKEA